MRFSKILLGMIFLMGCARTETINLQEESIEWLTDMNEGGTFQMIDDNNISQSWSLLTKDNSFSGGSSGILFITTKWTYREMSYENFRNNVLGQFSISVKTDYSSGNDYMSISTDGISVSFDLSDRNILDLHVEYGNGETIYWNYQSDEPLNTKPVIVDSKELGDRIYGETLIFRLEDYQNGLSENDIIAFYFTKDEGLIYLELKSGLKYFRV